MKLKELVVSPEVLQALQKMITEKIKNVGIVQLIPNSKTTEIQCLMAELCVVESKLEALMIMLDNEEKDFSKFNEHLVTAANNGVVKAISTREQMMAGLKKG